VFSLLIIPIISPSCVDSHPLVPFFFFVAAKEKCFSDLRVGLKDTVEEILSLDHLLILARFHRDA